MSMMTPLDKNDPRLVAWNVYTATEEFGNSKKWALLEEHIEGSFWAVFLEGWTRGAAVDQAAPGRVPSRHEHERGAPLTPDCDNWCRAKQAAPEGEEKAERGRALAGAETVHSIEQGPKRVNPPCAECEGPHPFDTTIPSPTWNRIIRGGSHADYLCATCILSAFVLAGEGFTAELFGKDFDGVPIEVRVRSVEAQTARDLGNENTQLRVELADAREAIRQAEQMLRQDANMHPQHFWLALPAVVEARKETG